ncbi:MAG: hypothetical protein IPP25_01225 [Saprospiraceae bacterium]|nr:hypothetical protein [Candidatus Opimibacter skivensis]
MLEKIMSHIVEFYKKYNLRKLNLSYIEPFRLSFFDKIFEVYSENYTFRFIVLKHYSAIVNNIISTNLPPQESLMRLDNYYKAHANRNIKEEYSQSDYENHKKWDLVCSEYLNIYLREMDLCIASKGESFFEMS